MLYPRKTKDGKLVANEQMVGYQEHLAQQCRILFLSGVIGRRCGVCGEQETDSQNLLLALDSLSHDPIKLIISSPGGFLDPAFFLYDSIRMIKSPVFTLGRYCASAAALILAAGGKRYLLPHAKVMLHLPFSISEGDTREQGIQYKESLKYERKLVDALIECGVKKSHEEILADIDRNLWLEPEEAIAYGLADKIMTPELMEEWLK